MEVARGVWLGPQLGVDTQTTCNDQGRRLWDEKKEINIFRFIAQNYSIFVNMGVI